MKPTSYELLRRTAAKAVETCPGVEAVVLFGSRARGTAHSKSDWDVAVLSRADSAVEQAACRLLGQHERVNAIVLKPEAIEKYRDRASRLEAAIARQGRLLAGAWSRPQCRMEHLDMEPDEFREDLEVAIRDIENAVTQLCNAALDDDEYVPNLVELSQQAAEAVAKSIVAGHGLTPTATHELNELATQLEKRLSRSPGWRGATTFRPGDPRAERKHEGGPRRALRPGAGRGTSRHGRAAPPRPATPDSLDPFLCRAASRPAGARQGPRPANRASSQAIGAKRGIRRDRAHRPIRNPPLGRGRRVDREAVGRGVNETASLLPRMA